MVADDSEEFSEPPVYKTPQIRGRRRIQTATTLVRPAQGMSSTAATPEQGLAVLTAPAEVAAPRELSAPKVLIPWGVTALAIDAGMLAAAGAAADLGANAAGVPPSPLSWLVAFALATLALMALRGMYAPRLSVQALEDVRGAVTAATLAAMGVLSIRVVISDDPDLAAQVLRPWAFAAVYVAAGRIALSWSQTQARRAGEEYRPTLIVGAGRVGALVAKRLLAQPELGLRPIGFLDKEPLADTRETGLPVLGSSWDLERVAEEHGVEHVIVSFSRAPHDVQLRLIKRCEELGIAVSFVPRLFEKVPGRLSVEHLGGLPLITAHRPDPKGWQFAVKYAGDRVAALVMLVIALPVLAIAAGAVWLSLGRPILFRQVRVGRDGRPFEMLKFRTMKAAGPAESHSAAVDLPPDTAPGGVEGADRRTRVGALMRRTSIDELPQILNVLKGEMSLVGPRPERPEFVELFEESVYRYGERHRVKAGITGWAQVHGLRGKTSLADRVEWDNYYIENWSLWLDLKIMLRTALRLSAAE
jgi:exopolysaccharide biosynthesis polyprenyl glycosylphosphotransferase